MRNKIKKIRKAFLSLAIAAACLAGQLGTPGTALAGDAQQMTKGVAKDTKQYFCGDWGYRIRNNGTAFINAYQGPDDVVELPSEIEGRTVTGFGKNIYLYLPDGTSHVTTLIIPETVTHFNSHCQINSIDLEEIIVKEGNPAFRSEDGVLYDKQMKTLLWCPLGKQGTLEVPEGVQIIEKYAFKRSYLSKVDLTEIRLPDSLREIGKEAFYHCSARFTEPVIPRHVEKIGEGAFSDCRKIKEICLPEGIKVVGEHMFSGCSKLTDVYLPQGITAIEKGAFAYCNFESIDLPKDVQSIGEGAFLGCDRLKSIDLPEGLTSIGEGAFSGCTKIKEIRLPEGIKTIGEEMFHDCLNLSDIYIPEGVESIGKDAFSGCKKLETIRLPQNVQSIGGKAFSHCDRLNNIVIPAGTKSIGERAFSYCGSLENIRIPDSVEEIGIRAFYKDSKITIECSDKSYAKTYAAENNIPYRIVNKAPGSKLGLTVNGQSVKDGQTLKVKTKKSYTLRAVRGGEKAQVKWKTSNAKVAAVKAGKVTVKKAGSSTITATAPDGKKTRIKLRAAKAAVRVSKVQVSGSKGMKRGSRQVLGLIVAPATADNTKVSWKSSNAKIATVDKKGKVTAKKKGTVVITAAAKDKSGKKGKIKITVK